VILRIIAPRIIDDKEFIYKNLEKEKQRNEKYLEEIKNKL